MWNPWHPTPAPPDLWILPRKRHSEELALQIQERYYDRVPPANRPTFLKDTTTTTTTPTEKSSSSDDAKPETTSTKKGKERKYDSSLIWAIQWVFFVRWWTAGLFKCIADTLKTVTPLVNKALLTFLTTSYLASHPRPGVPAPATHGIGYGIGLAFAIFAMQELASILTNHSMYLAMKTGMMVRSGIVSLIFRKALRLSPAARLKHSAGQITTMISTDAARLDFASAVAHTLWISPIQIVIGIALLIVQLGYSALVGVAILILSFPVQGALVRVMFKQRKKGVKLTDERVRLATEVLQGIRLLKAYAWEPFHAERVQSVREREIRAVRIMALSRAALIALVTATPTIAAVLSFITYALTNHQLTAPVIFTALQFLNIIRMPMIFLPFVISTSSDAAVALGRIGKLLLAEERQEPFEVDEDSKWAIQVDGAAFQWETADPAGAKKPGAKSPKKEKKSRKEKRLSTASTIPTGAVTPSSEKGKEEEPFSLLPLTLRIPHGAFVAIVGRVGSGKSSLLSALTGEMRRITPDNTITLGGSIAYVPQNPWIQNATLTDNVLFGANLDERKFSDVVHACALERDLEVLPAGRNTEIGEKGITLSGGQKARVALARAAYRAVTGSADIVLLDDVLSAVDAHVGKQIIDECLMKGPMEGKTRVLVTHALGVVKKADYIVCLEGGKIEEEGTYKELISANGEFARLVAEYGSQEKESAVDPENVLPEAEVEKGPAEVKKADQLMTEEERNTGAVEGKVYKRYLEAAGGIAWFPFILVVLTLFQASQVGNNLFLGYWTGRLIPGFSEGQYMAIYSALGVATAIFSFIGSFAFSILGLVASLRLFRAAFWAVVRSPVSFFDTTPMGRVMSRLSKDMDTLDTQLSSTVYQLLSTFSGVLGTVALVFYTFPLLGIIFAPMLVIYYVIAAFYRRSSVEAKRLDSNLRSALYASYTETLTGLSTVRAYREEARFIKNAEQALDVENRAYFLTVAIQRWLSLRLDLLGNILILGIALFAAGFRNTVDPSKIGVVLTYTLTITQQFSEMVTLYAQTEQNFNAVERVLTYSDLENEGETTTPNDPPPSWPSQGEIRFDNVDLSYREGLPLVLKDVSFTIKAGEKVGIVGRTGAGKSSILQALFRMVNVSNGTIKIDEVDTAKIGLEVLRTRLALVPQDSTLFLGNLRENLDPTKNATDAEIIDALRHVWLIPQENVPSDPKFSLDASVVDEGSNYSAGERQLLALARALVKRSRIIVLDEATSSIDVEADSRLQTTIQTEFRDSTLLCIAHRLNTIVYYDRVLVMDSGKVAEFDTPLNLFDREDSIFRSLCDEAQLTRADIVRIRAMASKDSQPRTTMAEAATDTTTTANATTTNATTAE